MEYGIGLEEVMIIVLLLGLTLAWASIWCRVFWKLCGHHWWGLLMFLPLVGFAALIIAAFGPVPNLQSADRR